MLSRMVKTKRDKNERNKGEMRNCAFCVRSYIFMALSTCLTLRLSVLINEKNEENEENREKLFKENVVTIHHNDTLEVPETLPH